MDFDDSPLVSIPAAVASALPHPSDSVGRTSKRLRLLTIESKLRSGKFDIDCPIARRSAMACARRAGTISERIVFTSAFGRVRLRSLRKLSTSNPGARSIESVAPFSQYDEI